MGSAISMTKMPRKLRYKWRKGVLAGEVGTREVEQETRFELATPTLARWCSTTELLLRGQLL